MTKIKRPDSCKFPDYETIEKILDEAQLYLHYWYEFAEPGIADAMLIGFIEDKINDARREKP